MLLIIAALQALVLGDDNNALTEGYGEEEDPFVAGAQAGNTGLESVDCH